MATKIPVTVITGFLGSGKTSLIRHLLQNNQGRRIAVLVNKFGELGIDGELLKSCQICPEDAEGDSNIFELTNGCLCCTVQQEFYPTMQELIKRRDSIDCILIETSGLALPKPLMKAFRWQEIRNAATVDAVITVVDCAAVAAGTFASDPEAIAVEDNLDSRPSHHDTEEDHNHDEEITSANLILDRTFDPEKLQLLLQTLAQQQEIYWIKGFVAVPNKSMRLVMQGVGTRFDKFYDRSWKPEESSQTRLVFIGRDLKFSEIESQLVAL
ncbi:MAG: GTP-binding protein [Nostoc sp.]|uniref:GTP-binding protein n=1 Tax=Nostoc sp. TaxID=1180 RepID=UPI002FFC1F61